MTPRPQQGDSGRWVDLTHRGGSAAVMLVLGVALLLAPPVWMAFGLSALFGALMWELTRLVAPSSAVEQIPQPRPSTRDANAAVLVGLSSALMMMLALLISPWALLLLAVPLTMAWRMADPSMRIALLSQAAIMALATYAIMWIKVTAGLGTLLWIIAIVILSDVAGYFVGRSVGGAKFWPAISPKKTWSGTVAGWVAAFVIGILLAVAGYGGWGLLFVGPLLVFAGQLGDIKESWLKRRAKVKDSSQLIPGHGGLMDRFDAMGASLALALLFGLAGWLPHIGI